MWTDDELDRLRARLVELAEPLPGATVEDSSGHSGVLLNGKHLAWLFVDHNGDGRITLCVKAPPGELETLTAADPSRYFRPDYVPGWVGVEVQTGSPDWPEIGALLEQAWRMRAGKRAIAAYDAGRA